MKKVTLRGTGQLNGPVNIMKILEMDDVQASKLSGLNRHEVILALLAIHYPGVKVKPNQIGICIESIR